MAIRSSPEVTPSSEGTSQLTLVTTAQAQPGSIRAYLGQGPCQRQGESLQLTNPAQGATWGESAFLSTLAPRLGCSSSDFAVFAAGTPPLLYAPQADRVVLASQVFSFYKPEVGPSTSTRILTHFIAILALLRWSGTEPTISLRCACSHAQTTSRHTQKYSHGRREPLCSSSESTTLP